MVMASGDLARRWNSEGVRLLRQSGVIVLARVGGAVCALGFTMVLSRVMGPEGMGQVSAAMALAMLLSLACTTNIEAGGVRFMISDIASGQLGRVRGFFRFASRYVWAGSALVVAVILPFVWLTDRGLPVCLGVIAAGLLARLRLGTGFAMGLSRPVLASVPGSLLRPLVFCMAVLIWVGVAGTITPTTAMALFLATLVPVVALQSVLIRRAMVSVVPTDVVPDTAPRRDWLRVGLTMGLSVMVVEYSIHIAVLVASAVIGPGELALLDVSLKLMVLLKFGVVAVTQVFQPQLSRAMAVGDREGVARCLATSGALRTVVVIGAVMIAVGAGPHVLGLFGPEFAAAYPILLLLLLDPVATVVLGPAANVISFSDRPQALLPALVPALVGLVAGTLLCGTFLGVWGVALAYVLARLVWLGWLTCVCVIRLGIDPTLCTVVQRWPWGR